MNRMLPSIALAVVILLTMPMLYNRVLRHFLLIPAVGLHSFWKSALVRASEDVISGEVMSEDCRITVVRRGLEPHVRTEH